MTMRREKTVALARALGVEVLAGEGTADLMDRCIEAAEEQGARREGARPTGERPERADCAAEGSAEERPRGSRRRRPRRGEARAEA